VENSRAEAYPPCPAKTAARIAMPNTPPSWRSVLKVPEALPIASAGTAAIVAFCAAGMAVDTPLPAMTNGRISCQ